MQARIDLMTVVNIQREAKCFPATNATDISNNSQVVFDKTFRLHVTQEGHL